MSITASIQARMASSRLPGKVLLPIGEKRVIEWAVDRVDAAELVDRTVVAIGDAENNKAIIEWCNRTGTEYIIGSETNLLDRHRTVGKQTKADILVRITGDSPFLPPEEIDRLIQNHIAHQAEYTTNYSPETPRGLVVDVITVEVLDTLTEQGESHPVSYLRKSGSGFRVEYSIDPKWADISEAPLEVNTPSQYWELVDALSATGPNPKRVGEWLIDRE